MRGGGDVAAENGEPAQDQPQHAVRDFDAFYAGAAARVTRQLVLLTGDLAEAEDVTHEAFTRAWLRWGRIGRLDSPEAWVRTVARRLAVSRWRKLRTAATAWHRHGGGRRDHIPALGVEHVALVEALRRLPERQRVAVVLFHLADLTVEQVAAETGASVSAVKQQLTRGRRALAGLLDEYDPQRQEPDRHSARVRGEAR
jgi:RNA polymerase sigma-70 factor (ECF subfamily)